MSSATPPSGEGAPFPASTPLTIDRLFGDPRFHADGDLVALGFTRHCALWTVEEPGLLRQWNPTTGHPMQHHELSDLDTMWVFSPQARLLASASDDLSLWEVATGQLLGTLSQPAWVTTIAFSPDTTLIATGHDDGMVRMWGVADHKLVREFAAHQVPISALAFSPDGLRLATAGEDRLIHLWDSTTGERQATLQGHTDRIPALAWHPQGTRLVSAGWDTTARVWDTVKAEPVILLNSHADQVNVVSFSPDGKILACADSENTIHLWHTVAWQTLHVLSEYEDEIKCLAFSPDSRQLASGGAERVIHLWDPQRGKLLSGSNSPARHAISVGQSEKGPRLASTCGGTALRVWDPNQDEPVLAEDQTNILAVACSPDGRFLAGGGSDTRIHLWNMATGEALVTFIGQRGPVAALALSPDSSLLASASASDGTVWLWNVATGEPKLLVLEAADGCTVDALAFHPEGRLLACGGIDWLATGGTDGAICVWDINKPGKIALFEFGTTSLAFHPSGRWLAAASLSEVVFIFDIATQETVAELAGHTEGVTCITFSPDGRYLASGSEDRMLRLWDAESHELLAVHELDTPVQALCFSPDGKYLFTGNGNTTCYQIETARLIEEA